MVCPVRLIWSGSPGLGLSIVLFLLLEIVHSLLLHSIGLSLRCLLITPHRQRTLVIQMETDCCSGLPIPSSRPRGYDMSGCEPWESMR
jgi:hypothetical protein